MQRFFGTGGASAPFLIEQFRSHSVNDIASYFCNGYSGRTGIYCTVYSGNRT